MADQIEDFGERGTPSRRAVRFANQTDLDGCIALDHPTIPAEVIKHKKEFAKLKRELARKSQGDHDLYAPDKAEFIEAVLRMTAEC